MFAAAERGDIPKKVVKEFAHATPSIKRLPDKAQKEALHKISKDYKK